MAAKEVVEKMSDDGLVTRLIHELRHAGLPEILDDRRAGGFAVQPDHDVVYVVWSPSDELSDAAFDRLTSGDITAPMVHHMGTINHAMADAMLGILVSAGFNTVMSADDMAPATIEVRSAV
jgi:hypothetical protein